MGKRSSFSRRPRDFYPSPVEVVAPLVPHLTPCTRYVEPCAGDGALIQHLAPFADCVAAYDIDPQGLGIAVGDATLMAPADFAGADMVITNPPWERKVLHSIISRLMVVGMPAWLLFDADWSFTGQAREYLPYCEKILAIGRVKWIPGSKSNGMDHAAWYFFTPDPSVQTQFWGKP